MILLKTPAAIIGFPLLVLGVHGVASFWGAYRSVAHFDSFMHIAGGLVAALSLYGILGIARDRGVIRIDDHRVLRLLIVALVSLVALGWELLEFLADVYLGTEWQPSIADTMKDQCLGILGATAAVLRLKP